MFLTKLSTFIVSRLIIPPFKTKEKEKFTGNRFTFLLCIMVFRDIRQRYNFGERRRSAAVEKWFERIVVPNGVVIK